MEQANTLQHFGIKGQKWGLRRFQNKDGSLTEEGKIRYQNDDGSLTDYGREHYMEGARTGKLDVQKLSDRDLQMINNRFNQERIFNQNVTKFEEEHKPVSEKLAQALVDKITATANNPKNKNGQNSSGVKNGLKQLFVDPILDAFKFEDLNADSSQPQQEEEQNPYGWKDPAGERGSGFRFSSGWFGKNTAELTDQHRIETGENFTNEQAERADNFGWHQRFNHIDRDNPDNGSRTAESIMRERHNKKRDYEEAHPQEKSDQSGKKSKRNKNSKNDAQNTESDSNSDGQERIHTPLFNDGSGKQIKKKQYRREDLNSIVDNVKNRNKSNNPGSSTNLTKSADGKKIRIGNKTYIAEVVKTSNGEWDVFWRAEPTETDSGMAYFPYLRTDIHKSGGKRKSAKTEKKTSSTSIPHPYVWGNTSKKNGSSNNNFYDSYGAKPKKKRNRGFYDAYAAHGAFDDIFIITRDTDNAIAHFGIKGQKWGVRRFENADGTLTAEGKERYRSGTSEKSTENRFNKKESVLTSKAFSGQNLSSKERDQLRSMWNDRIRKGIQLRNKMTSILKKNDAYNNIKDERTFSKKDQQGLADIRSQLNVNRKAISELDFALSTATETKYAQEIKNETKKEWIDPALTTFGSKDEKINAEESYLKRLTEPPTVGDEERWERELGHMYNRVTGLSMDGYEGIPKSDRQKAEYDYVETDDSFDRYDNWRPKYEQSRRWKELQAERQKINDLTGRDKARNAYNQEKSVWKREKLWDDYIKASRLYNERIKGIEAKENGIKQKHKEKLLRNLCLDLGYEPTEKTMRYLSEFMWN